MTEDRRWGCRNCRARLAGSVHVVVLQWQRPQVKKSLSHMLSSCPRLETTFKCMTNFKCYLVRVVNHMLKCGLRSGCIPESKSIYQNSCRWKFFIHAFGACNEICVVIRVQACSAVYFGRKREYLVLCALQLKSCLWKSRVFSWVFCCLGI